MNFLATAVKQFEYYKHLGDKTFEQVSDEALFWQANDSNNSIALIVKHLWGNMKSRWTDFLNSDGEKSWRDRDSEFENDVTDRKIMLERWNEGWEILFQTLKSLNENDLEKVIYIRNQGHFVMEAILRQIAHYAYHVGQIVVLGKLRADDWQTLSIPKGNSKAYNAEKFAQPKTKEHFTDEILGKNE